jgi:hypothetical protein
MQGSIWLPAASLGHKGAETREAAERARDARAAPVTRDGVLTAEACFT